MKKNRVFSGVLLIAAAVLLLLIAVFPPLFGLTTGQIIGSFFCIVLAVYVILNRSVHLIFIPIAVLYVLWEDFFIKNLHIPEAPLSRWILVAIVILLCAGTRRLLGNSGARYEKPSDCDYVDNGDTPHHAAENNVGSKIRYVDAASLADTRFENNLGKLEIFIQNEENYPGGLTLHLENNLGCLIVHVPASWNVIERNSENQLGDFTIRANSNPNGKTLFIQCENNLGKTMIVSP